MDDAKSSPKCDSERRKVQLMVREGPAEEDLEERLTKSKSEKEMRLITLLNEVKTRSNVTGLVQERRSRTPENSLRCRVQNVEKIWIFIRTILTNFYPEIGFGLQCGQFLSGRSDMASPEPKFRKIFRLQSICIVHNVYLRR